jgi:hypothetical protein
MKRRPALAMKAEVRQTFSLICVFVCEGSSHLAFDRVGAAEKWRRFDA